MRNYYKVKANILSNVSALAIFFYVLLATVLMPRAAFSQQITWTDGDSAFIFIDATRTKAVAIDSSIKLLSTSATASEADTFQLHLSGIDAEYKNVNKAVVVDFNSIEGLNLYFITDASARRIFAIRSEDGFEVTELKGAPGSQEELINPVSARAFRDPNDLKVLVTDQGSNRVLKFDLTTKLLEYIYPPAEPGFEELNTPSAAVPVPDTSWILVSDSRNNRILLIDTATNATLWQIGPIIINDVGLSEPVDVEWVNAGGDTSVLITDRGNHRVIRVKINGGGIVWQFGKTGQTGLTDSTLNNPVDAQYLTNGNILITDTGNKRVIEVDPDGKIVWRFLGDLPELESAFRLSENRTLVISDNELIRLGYSTKSFESGLGAGKLNIVHDLRREVIFDTLRWQLLQQTAGTNARFQLRSAADFADLAIAEFSGPSGPGSFYTSSPSVINSSHSGHRFFDFHVELITDNFLYTPILNQVNVNYHFFEPDSVGILTTPVIRDSSGFIISRWLNLTFFTAFPDDPQLRDDVPLLVRILHAEEDRELAGFVANLNSEGNSINLSQLDILKGVQALRLQAELQTNNSSVSPVLTNWSLTWDRVVPSIANIQFRNQLGSPTAVFRTDSARTLGANPPRNVFLELNDDNILQIKDTVRVNLRALRSGDVQQVILERQGSGNYILPTGTAVVIADKANQGNGIIEAFDRDILMVQYIDPLVPSDIATDSAQVILRSTGTLRVENQKGDSLTNAIDIKFGDSLFLFITGETDQNLSPAPDTIFAGLLDRDTNDSEQVTLVERSDNAGSFQSVSGVLVVKDQNGVRNDGRLQTVGSNDIIAQYIDNVTLEVPLHIEPDTSGTGPAFVTGEGAFNFLLAPNPYQTKSSAPMRMRMEAYSGNLKLQKVDIYNISGERIRTLDASLFAMDSGLEIKKNRRSTTISQWWDFRSGSRDGPGVSSGTYWAIFTAIFSDDNSIEQKVTFRRKFIIIQ